MKPIRNFCIIAHIDHGKSTLADRLLEFTNTITEREREDQLLDDMDLEKERGITIKSHAIQMDYPFNGIDYTINLIDTPGHVDFSYEVSRSIASCEGALLLVDATQGIQAQTISNLYLALENDLEIIPVVNKIDMDGAMIEEVKDQIVDLIGCERDTILEASGRSGIGIESVLEAVIERIPAPKFTEGAKLQAMIFDSVFNPFRGVIAYFRIFNGTLRKNDKIRFLATQKDYNADEIGILRLKPEIKDLLGPGDVGYIITGIKQAKEIKVGDTITLASDPSTESVKGFEDVKPMVFAGIYPIDSDDFEDLRDSLEKLQLNDASLVYEPETSIALGFGFRCGFLGLLHLEIVSERLEREFDQNIIVTVPQVSYNCYLSKDKDKAMYLHNPAELPDVTTLDRIEEPWIKSQIITKPEFIGSLMNLCMEKRGILQNQHYLTPTRVELQFEMRFGSVCRGFSKHVQKVVTGIWHQKLQHNGG
jgi:GTP-binding protein LepA